MYKCMTGYCGMWVYAGSCIKVAAKPLPTGKPKHVSILFISIVSIVILF